MKNVQFAQEFEHHRNYLNGFAMKLTRDRNAANDLFQETALKAFRYQNKFISNTNLKAWLSTIMKNSFINQYQKHKRRNEIQDATSGDFYLNTGGSTAFNEGEMNMNIREITSIIDTLDDNLRIPFLMSYQGYQYNEIQKALGNLPIGTIKSRIHQARKKLKTRINMIHREAAPIAQ